jgi:hypothetical protein
MLNPINELPVSGSLFRLQFDRNVSGNRHIDMVHQRLGVLIQLCAHTCLNFQGIVENGAGCMPLRRPLSWMWQLQVFQALP